MAAPTHTVARGIGVFLLAAAVVAVLPAVAGTASDDDRPRARDLGLVIGSHAVGELNAITDVPGLKVGQASVVKGEAVRTGVTAVLPHGGNIFHDKVPAAVIVGNGFGKLVGSTQIEELGTLETPILLCGTLNVPRVADALITYMLSLPGMEDIRSVNPVVGETNDGALNDIRGRHVGEPQVLAALESAASGPVAEGSVGAGTGTRALGFKGGIGTSSRVVRIDEVGSYTVGVLVQTNFGGELRVGGLAVGDEVLRRMDESLSASQANPPGDDGSCMIVVATDAPLESRNLRRLAARALGGMARAGASFSNGSGDYVLAFSTAESVRVRGPRDLVRGGPYLGNDAMSGLFEAVIEATEEAILNSLLRATDVTGRGGVTSRAIPIDLLLEVCREKGLIDEPR